MVDESQVSKFYSSKNILITGGTGFMGKVLIWKLLQSCPELDTIYILIRPKYGRSITYRKGEFLNAPIFNNFKKDNPSILDKVAFVCGDVGQDGLGLSDEDRNMLINKVSVVFHNAAILKMNSDLRTAVNINTTGTVRMLEMAQQMNKLEAFVYISTAYCNCENNKIEEKIYSSKHNPYDVIALIRWMDLELLEKITPKLIYPSPNTYIYSKRLAENLLQNYVSKVPIIVARPSIVLPSFKEPLPGWNDSFNGPAGFFAAAGSGIMRSSKMNMDRKTNIIPVDMAINSVLLLPWANSREKLLQEINVYNVTQNYYEGFNWADVIKYLKNSIEKYPFNRILWYPQSGYTGDNIITYTIKCIFVHYLPAYIIDFILLLVGKKPFLVRIHDKLRLGEELLMYFSEGQWTFAHDKLLQLETLLNDTDKHLFATNMNIIGSFQNYADDMALSAKVYLLKEDMSTIDTARRTAKIMYAIDKITLVLRYYVFWRILMFAFNSIMSIFS